MSDRTKEIIIKTNLVIGLVFLLILFPVLPIISFFLDEKLISLLFYIDLCLFFISGILFAILLPVFGLKQKPVKADKIPFIFDNFQKFSSFLEKTATQNGYQAQPALPTNERSNVTVYIRSRKLWALDCIAIIRVPELTDEILHAENDKITEILINYYGTERMTDWISMISIICVDRITPAFQKLVNSNIRQGFKNFRLPVGISFGGKSIYIAKQRDGFAIGKYRKLRKEFLKLLAIC